MNLGQKGDRAGSDEGNSHFFHSFSGNQLNTYIFG